MGVLDVLPHALSSKYFFWDSDYAALAPGKFSALKEAEWVQRAAQTCPALHYYYMGFYIHSCHKMRYKADYHPSDLLCPGRLTWVPFEHVKAALDVSWMGLQLLVPHAAMHAFKSDTACKHFGTACKHFGTACSRFGTACKHFGKPYWSHSNYTSDGPLACCHHWPLQFLNCEQPSKGLILLQSLNCEQPSTGLILLLFACNIYLLVTYKWHVVQEKEYQVLSDVHGAAEGPGTCHDITAEPQQNSNSAKLSNAKVGDEAMSASLVYWRDLDSPYQLMRFGDMEDFGVSEVCAHIWSHC